MIFVKRYIVAKIFGICPKDDSPPIYPRGTYDLWLDAFSEWEKYKSGVNSSLGRCEDKLREIIPYYEDNMNEFEKIWLRGKDSE